MKRKASAGSDTQPRQARGVNAAEIVKAALESADAGIWDKHYGHGLSVEYAQRLHSEIQAAIASLGVMRQQQERVTAAIEDAIAVIEAWQERGLSDLSIDGIANALRAALRERTQLTPSEER